MAGILWNLVTLRAELLPVSYLNDSSVHEQMVRFATAGWSSAHPPVLRWFPYLGEGSPQFLHYQSLPAMLTGGLGAITGANLAFRLTLYLLLSLWPISIYVAARLLGGQRWTAGTTALLSPLLNGATQVGYEQRSYLWIGYGVWAQLWAMATLPLAWGFSWRALQRAGKLWPAVVTVSLTVALHFETGYLALAALALWPLVMPRDRLRAAARSMLTLVGVALATAWVIVPLLHMRPWAATNEALRQTPLVNGYGAGKVLGWAVSGQVLDSGRLPVLSLLAGVGLLLALSHWRRDASGRTLVVALVFSLLLSFGRTTFGEVADLLPGASDLFFRRFMMGAQLAGLLLAGSGATWLTQLIAGRVNRLRDRWRFGSARASVGLAAVGGLAAVLILSPAWSQILSVDQQNGDAVGGQRRAEADVAPQINRLIDVISAHGGGRVYAGTPYNWGTRFTVGAVPVFKYLESRDVDEVGYTLRTASLMTGPEYYFDERYPGDFRLFGIRYLMLPPGHPPPVPATRSACAGQYCLWILRGPGYLQAGQLVGVIHADRTNLGRRNLRLLHSGLPTRGNYLAVAFPGLAAPPPAPVIRFASPHASAARLKAIHVDLSAGRASVTVRAPRPTTVVLSASFDPGWRAGIDGRPGRTLMVAPALTATTVPAGSHRVSFTYNGYGGYVPLLALAGLTLLALPLVERRLRR